MDDSTTKAAPLKAGYMAFPVPYWAGSLLPNGARRVPHMNLMPCCAIQVPLRRPVSPQAAKALITREQLLSSIAARTSTSTPSISNSLFRETVELATLIDVLPARVRTALQHHTALSQLVEVVLDLGRPVVARFTEGAELLSRDHLTQEELEEVTDKACVYAADGCSAPIRCWFSTCLAPIQSTACHLTI